MVAKRSPRAERTQTINQARALVMTGPDDLRARFARHTPAALVAELAALRPRPGDIVGYATRVALRELGRRAQFLDSQLSRLDELIVPLVTAHAPGLLALHGVGPDTAALLLIAAGDHPERLRSEAAWAHLCAAAPIPASSGKTTRHRLNPAGDRQANHALWRIAITRMSSHPATRTYVKRRTERACPRKKSSAASSATSPARPTPTSGPPPGNPRPRGRPDPLIGCRATCWPANDPSAAPGPHPGPLDCVTS
jgi:transposase